LSAIVVSEERGVRYLHFGSPWVQGAMRIARPAALELEYTRELLFPLLLRGEGGWPRSVLQLGLGAASIARFLDRQLPAARQTIVEISPEVVETARRYFKLPEAPQLILGDGADYLAAGSARFDLIVVDGFDERGRAGRLDSVPFYMDVARRLSRHGMVAINLLTRRKSAEPSVARLREAFDDRVLELPPSEAGNVVLLAAAGAAVEASIEELRDAARRLKDGIALDLRPTVARLAGRTAHVVL
jgi:spermidine synthase